MPRSIIYFENACISGHAPVLPTTVLTNQQQLEAHLQLALQSGSNTFPGAGVLYPTPGEEQTLPDFNQANLHSEFLTFPPRLLYLLYVHFCNVNKVKPTNF